MPQHLAMKIQSRASLKFLSQHPTQHRLLIGQIETAKQQKYSPPAETEDTSPEVLNMKQNRFLMMFTEQDRVKEEQKKRKLSKRISWSENLIEIRTVVEWEDDEVEDAEDRNIQLELSE